MALLQTLQALALEWSTVLGQRPQQSSYARCPHGTTPRKQRTVATAAAPDSSLRVFCQELFSQARSER